MSGRVLALLTLVPLVATTASAQVVRGVVSGLSSGATSLASVEDVITRVMSFDRDRDGLVRLDELHDRMQPLVERGDRDGNLALDRAEVRALAAAPPASVPGTIDFTVSRYGFGDQIGISSRSHIESAIEDLRLDAPTRERALAVANAFVDALESDVSSTLLASAGPWLMPEQLDALGRVVTRVDGTRMVFADQQAPALTGTVGAAMSLVKEFQLPPLHQEAVSEALDRYAGRLGVGEATRLALARELEGVLDDEQLGNLRAALERRPVVSTGAVAIVNTVITRVQGQDGAVQSVPVVSGSPAAPAAR